MIAVRCGRRILPTLAQHLASITARNPPPSTGAAPSINRTELPESVRRAMEALGYGDPAKRP